jgi:two-component system sensor histidine kinase RegB
VVVLIFSTHLAKSLRAREAELGALRERFTRNEGIVALATHAASVAHELNTPLATLTLLVDDMAEQECADTIAEDLATAQLLLTQCRQRVRALAAQASSDSQDSTIALSTVLSQWQLVRPTISLDCNGDAPLQRLVEPGIAHLLMVLLNNAADAGQQAGNNRVDLLLRIDEQQLHGEVRDYGRGFNPAQAALPGRLFNSGKSDGLGVGLALSHATIERLGGRLWMRPANGAGTRVGFSLPLQPGTCP